ncbi:MAG: type II toxin-antitoxin system HicA family toxin [Deltaproteobacteria bacterium]|nr:MAG: type II toxin-antitoxin system HicA family toxin [Deltaproteobacteria bacterium]
MKRVDLLRLLNDQGCRIIRHGARHDIFLNPANQRRAPIPRHREIPDSLVKIILKQLDLGTL